MTMLAPYIASFRARFATASQYKAAIIAGVATQAWWAVISLTVYSALYAGRGSDQPINLSAAIAYTWMQQCMFALLPFSCDPEVANSLRSGSIAYDRIRPVDTYFWWYSRALAKVSGRVFPRFAIMFVFASVILPAIGLGRWSLTLPPDAAAGIIFVFSMALGLLISAAVAVFMDALASSMMSPAGVNAILMPTVLFLSGNVLPLPLLPQMAQHLALLQPFAALADIPIRIYLGAIPLSLAPVGVAIQLFWLVTLTVLGRWLLNKTMSRLEIQGG